MARHLASGEIYLELADKQRGLRDLRGASQQRTDARQEFGETKRLDEVVIGPAVEPSNAVLEAVLCRKNEHWNRTPLLSEPAQQLEAIDMRNDYIENDQVIGFIRSESTGLNSSHITISYAVFC